MARVPQDPDCYSGTHVLENCAGFQDQAQLDAFEAHTVAYNAILIARRPISGPFDQVRLRTTHQRLFDGVYRWAGAFRQRPGVMSKRRESGALIVYGDAAHIERELARVFRELDSEAVLAGLDPEAFARRAAYFYGELDAIHPFREGNSRTLRRFFLDVAHRAGHRLNWTLIESGEVARARLYAARDAAVLTGDTTDLATLFRHALSGATPEPPGTLPSP